MARITCPGCQRKIPVTAEDAGVMLECSQCGATMEVPALDQAEPNPFAPASSPGNSFGQARAGADEIKFVCPECGKRGHAPYVAAGKVVSCPRCKKRVKVPALNEELPMALDPLDVTAAVPALEPLALESIEAQVVHEAPAQFKPGTYRCPFCGTGVRWTWQPYRTTLGKVAMISFCMTAAWFVVLAMFITLPLIMALSAHSGQDVAMVLFAIFLGGFSLFIFVGISLGLLYLAQRYLRAWRQVCSECGTIVGHAS